MFSWLTLLAAKKVLGTAVKWLAANWFPVLILGSLAAGGVYVWHLRSDRDAYRIRAELADKAIESIERDRNQWEITAGQWRTTARDLQRANSVWADAAVKYDAGLQELLAAIQAQPAPPGYDEAEGQISEGAASPDPARAIITVGSVLAGLMPPE